MSNFETRLPRDASEQEKRKHYKMVRESIASLVDGQDDWFAVLSTVVCELHNAFDAFDWTGFYRAVSSDQLRVGPYQGAHGCLSIAFNRGVCGAAARTRKVQRVDDVNAREDHIACSSSTKSEIVLPLVSLEGELLAVLDVDSNDAAAFSQVDEDELLLVLEILAVHPSRPIGFSRIAAQGNA